MPGGKKIGEAKADIVKEINEIEKTTKKKVEDLKIKLGNIKYYQHEQEKKDGKK